MGSFNVNPTTILSKIHVRTPSQAESLSSRYVFLNLNNAEPNLGKPPGIYGGTYYSTLTSDEYLGIRYALLSNNHSGSAWRVWAYDNPRIAAYSKEGSLGIGDNAYPLNIKSFVYSNYAFDNQNNRYNSQSFSNKTFNVFALSGIYLFDSTTIGDPASAIAFIVTDTGNVGIGVEDPAERLTVNGNISSNGSLFVRDLSANNLTVSGNISASGNLTINGNTTLGDSNLDTLTLNGTSVSIPNNLNFDVNTLFIDAANNKVGIGTDTPDQNLHVLKASAGTVTADTNSIAVFEGNGSNHITILTPDAQTGGVVFGSPGDIIGSYLTWNYGNNALKLATASNNGFIQLLTNNELEAVRITSGGSVGIGTTVPAEKLTVLGNISASGSTRTALLSVVRNTAGADAAIQIIAGNASGDAASIFFGHADSQSRGQIRYYNGGTDALTFSCATSEAMRIRANGNVGIGTTVPGEKLTVSGNISARDGIIGDSLTARFINLTHSPLNDGVFPNVRLGETETTGFSGFNITYNENNNKLITAPTFGTTTLTATSIDRFCNIEQPNGFYVSSVSQVSAAGTTQTTASAIFTTVTTVTGADTSVGGLLLPQTNGGHLLYVYNFGANSINVYPQVGGRISGFAVDAPYVMAIKNSAIFQSLSSNFWVGVRSL